MEQETRITIKWIISTFFKFLMMVVGIFILRFGIFCLTEFNSLKEESIIYSFYIYSLYYLMAYTLIVLGILISIVGIPNFINAFRKKGRNKLLKLNLFTGLFFLIFGIIIFISSSLLLIENIFYVNGGGFPNFFNFALLFPLVFFSICLGIIGVIKFIVNLSRIKKAKKLE